ncbi:signal peptidase I [Gryllotalpicola koreensis]|uniref:Signal peptidase I n=1 Tax=Gryllotalpicola koreensis TaxID=993086 RepID=A0ABP8A0B4_9MICO
MTTMTLELTRDAPAETTRGEEPRPASTPSSGEKTERGAFWRALWTGISAGILAVIIGIAMVTVVVPHVARATPLTVLTGSMRPHLPPGTLLVVRPVKPADIRIGDVVTYEPNPNDTTTVISHRVIAITSNSDGTRTFTVKGDANNAADAPVMQKQVVAKLWYSVPLMGWVNAYVGGVHRGWMIPIAAALLLAYAAWNLVFGAVQQARRRTQKHGRRRAEAA